MLKCVALISPLIGAEKSRVWSFTSLKHVWSGGVSCIWQTARGTYRKFPRELLTLLLCVLVS